MTSNGERVAALFIGGGATPIEKIAVQELKILKENGVEAASSADRLNTLWCGADVASIVTSAGWSVMTGGYYEGPLGIANKTASVISHKHNNIARPMGVIFPEKYPNDPLTIEGQLFRADDTADRLKIYNDKSQAFFLMGGGGLGTGEEIFFTLKEVAGYDEVAVIKGSEWAKQLNLSPRPILVVDPTEKVQELLKFYFIKSIDQARRQKDPVMRSLFKRVYIFGKSSFRKVNNDKYPGLLRLSESSKKEIIAILGRYSGEQVELPAVETFADILLKHDQSIQ